MLIDFFHYLEVLFVLYVEFESADSLFIRDHIILYMESGVIEEIFFEEGG